MSSFGSRNERDGVTSRFRLRGHDYSHPGFYFITICIADRSHVLGTISEGVFTVSAAGEMVLNLWEEQATRFPEIQLDEFCIMPNHFHALVGVGTRDDDEGSRVWLPSIVQGFKAATTVAYGRGVKALGWPPYEGRLWQKGYHDHVVRNDRDLDRIRGYIRANPSQWERDTFFPPGLGHLI